MAEAVVSFVLERLTNLMVTEGNFLYGVSDEVEEAKSELQRIRCFLKDADARARYGDETFRNYIAELTDAAYELEDIIATYASKMATSKEAKGIHYVKKKSIFVFDRYKVGSKIDKISTKIAKVRGSFQSYGLESRDWQDAYSSNVRQMRELRRAYSFIVERDVVGFDNDINKLIHYLKEEGNASRVVSICGMGGLGKTTLARKIYQNGEVKHHFDSLAWVSISQQCQVRDVWEEILTKLHNLETEKIRKMSDGQIANKLYHVQKESKCLVILDDIWTMTTWNSLKPAFPVEDDTRSKLLLTTRNKDVAQCANRSGVIHEPECLDEDKSWELFQKKTSFGSHANLEDNQKMEELGRHMLKHCGGLPLAIIVLSGLLSREPTVYKWEIMLRNVKACINRGKMNVQEDSKHSGVSWVLGLSYDEMPYHLKSCFLYLAHYPEDYEIHVKEICYMWMAEGFVSSGETMEDLVYSCVLELVERSMLQVGKLDSTDGRVKTCRMHDLIRDLCLIKAQEENFMRAINSKNQDKVVDSLSSSLEHGVLTCKNRRLFVHCRVDHMDELLASTNNLNACLRTFACFHEVCPIMKLFVYFKVLRVLKIEGQSVCSWCCPKEIGELMHLRFLSLKNSSLSDISSFSLRNLRYLQILDLRVRSLTKNFKMPEMPIESRQLRHFYYFNLCHPQDAKGPNELYSGSLKSLRTLVNIPATFIDSNHWAQLTNLTKIGIFVEVGKNLEDIFEYDDIMFNHLESLSVAIRYYNLYDTVRGDIMPIIKRCPRIHKLSLDFPVIKLPDFCQFSRNLIKITMRRTWFEDDPMPILEKLPKLKILCLDEDAFEGNEMVCSQGGFPQLESLSLHGQKILKDWRMEEGALPRLSSLHIICCHQLRALPDGLKDITSLKELVIKTRNSHFEKRVKRGGEDFYKIQHVPLRRIN